MVLPQTDMYSGVEKPRLRAVMLQNDSGTHYIYLTAEKPKDRSRAGLSVVTPRGK